MNTNNFTGHPALADRAIHDLAWALTQRHGVTIKYRELADLIVRGPAIGVAPAVITKALDRLTVAASNGNELAAALLKEVTE